MKLKARAAMQSKPAFRLTTRTGPLPFSAKGSGSAIAEVEAIDVTVEQIPLYARIPFKGGLQRVAAIGGFRIHSKPFRVALDVGSVHVSGVLGDADGMDCEVCGTLDCGATFDVDGRLAGQIARVALAFDEDELLEEQAQLTDHADRLGLKD